MAGMTNPAIKNLESRMSELEREMSDLREKVESKETIIIIYQKIYQKKRMLLIYKKKKKKILQM